MTVLTTDELQRIVDDAFPDYVLAKVEELDDGDVALRIAAAFRARIGGHE